jgi:hypothetical protein
MPEADDVGSREGDEKSIVGWIDGDLTGLSIACLCN